jgi:hypothetical protein
MSWLWWMAMAWAGSGPWVPGNGSGSLYLGVDGQQIRSLSATIDGQRQTLEVGEGLASVNLSGVLTYGIAPNVEVEATVPVNFIHALRDDAPLCGILGADACEPTHTVGVLSSHLKWLVVDEVVGAPLSVAVGGLVRFGGLVAQQRDRLTNAGEGTLDGGGLLSLGKSGAMGEGYWTVYGDIKGLYRVPNTQSYPLLRGDRAVPGAELHAAVDALFAPKGTVAFGPSTTLLWRPAGVDYGEVVLADIDRFGALRVTSLAAGGKLIFRDAADNAIVFGLARTVWAQNNPADQLSVSLGIALNRLFDRSSAEEG